MASKEVGYCHAARATSQSANLPIFLFSSLRCQWDRVPQGRSETPKANLATTRPVRMAAFSLPPRISDAEVRDRGKNTQPRSATRSTTWILCEINTRRDTASNPSVALPTGLLSSPVQLTGLRSAQWWPSYYLSYYLYLPACRATSLVLWLPRHPTMLCWLGYLSLQPQHYMYDMRPGLERCSSYCQVDVFVLIGGEHGTLFVDYLTTSPLLTSDAGCNIYIDWYHTSPKATHLALVVHHESEDCATPTQRCI